MYQALDCGEEGCSCHNSRKERMKLVVRSLGCQSWGWLRYLLESYSSTEQMGNWGPEGGSGFPKPHGGSSVPASPHCFSRMCILLLGSPVSKLVLILSLKQLSLNTPKTDHYTSYEICGWVCFWKYVNYLVGVIYILYFELESVQFWRCSWMCFE